MSRSRSTPLPTVQERFSIRPHLVAGLAAFLVTGLTVHFFAQHGLRQGSPAQPAPVRVRVELPEVLASGLREANTPDAIKGLSSYFRREDLLRQAWQEFTARRESTPGGTLPKVLGSYPQFTSSLGIIGTKTAGGYRFDLQLVSLFPDEAAEYLKILARQFVRQCQSERAALARRRAIRSQEDFRRAKVEYREARNRLNRFEEEFLRREAERRLAQQSAALQKKEQAAVVPLTENPRWIELHNALESARDTEAILLKKVTALHPRIVVLRRQMQEMEGEIAATPRWLAKENGGSPRPNPLPEGERMNMDSEELVRRMNALEIHRQLQQDIEKAAANYRRTRDAVQLVEVQSPELPPGAIQVFLPAEAKPRAAGNFRLLGLSLGSALMMAVGVCFVSLGTSLEPLVARLADLERLVGVPILGLIPGRQSGISPVERGRRRAVARWTFILSGLALTFGATAAILMVFSRFAG
ncbi:MAG: hypothetical protein JXB10_17495 [Pirellulales bacterium]|nr:hypothetical protein [Pirellulales bacterium]